MKTVKIFNYKIIQEKSISKLKEFSNHRRLIVFIKRGTKCVSCEKLGTRLIQGMDKKGNLHWDVYTQDLYPLTVDHIIPKSKGGSEDINNKQPMCSKCNSKKGNKHGDGNLNHLIRSEF